MSDITGGGGGVEHVSVISSRSEQLKYDNLYQRESNPHWMGVTYTGIMFSTSVSTSNLFDIFKLISSQLNLTQNYDIFAFCVET